MINEIQAKHFSIAFFDGETNKCFEEDRYGSEFFNEAYEYYKLFNSSYKKGRDYVRLYAFLNEKIGHVLICDFKPSL